MVCMYASTIHVLLMHLKTGILTGAGIDSRSGYSKLGLKLGFPKLYSNQIIILFLGHTYDKYKSDGRFFRVLC